ncbi:MAG: tannase/feruloyl esterase family alpha/beta hydrolase, partial [Gammaproteobacteria bacterium]
MLRYGWVLICVVAMTATAAKAQTKSEASGELLENKVITEADCTVEKIGATIPASAIGEPVSAVTLNAPVWTGSSGSNPGYCSVNGSMTPVSEEPNARPINFQVVLPASWSLRAAQLGGGGMNGMIPNLLGGVDMGPGPSLIQRGFVTYGSDSGHQMSFGFGRGGPGGPGRASGPGGPAAAGSPGGAPATGSGDDWTLNDEAMKNLGYMQLKKTHDAAMVLIDRMY